MNSETIYEVITRIIGSIHAIGSCHIDNERYENLDVFTDVHYLMMRDLFEEVENIKRYEASMKSSGKRVLKYLKFLRDEIDVYIGEVTEDE